MTPSNWADPGARCISIYLDGDDAPDRADDGTFLVDDDFLVLVNGWWEPLPFVIPDVGQAHAWTVELNTYDWRAAPAPTPTRPGGLVTVGPAVDHRAAQPATRSTVRRPTIPTHRHDQEHAQMTLTGKVAIVTGGNSGIGKAVALGLAAAGANIVIDYVTNEQATEDLEQQIVALGDKAIGVDADVSKVEDLERLVAAAVSAFGQRRHHGQQRRHRDPHVDPRHDRARSTTGCSTSTSRAPSSAPRSPPSR